MCVLLHVCFVGIELGIDARNTSTGLATGQLNTMVAAPCRWQEN
jgi:hypothetical protein